MSSHESGAAASRHAACLNCRRSKVRCKRATNSITCERCKHAGSECVTPSFHVGRAKGVKNKRTGLEKAIHQIKEAVKNSKTDAPRSEGAVAELQQLLDEARDALPTASEPYSPARTNFSLRQIETTQASKDQLSLDDAENPLQLLARATDLRPMTPQLSEANISTLSTRNLGTEREGVTNISRFFQPIQVGLDGNDGQEREDTDPIELGLITMEEAEMLLSFFHEKLAHTRWGLDPLVHSLSFVRSRSAFLFTSILAASALFLPSTHALARRLTLHRRALAQQMIAKRVRSVEVVLAFLVAIPWMHPGAHSSDDDTGLYISIALSIALDLSLNKIIVPSPVFDQDLMKRVSKADCIHAQKALAMDRFESIEAGSEWGQRLLRRRERAWIALFVLERGVCLARGRSFSVPITPLIQYCDGWHAIDIADSRDGSLTSMAVLRRDLDGLFNAVRSRCDSYRVIDVGSEVAREIEASIERFYDRWLKTWTLAIGEGEQRALPPYVEILITHTRLSTYSGVINHPTAPLEVKRQFRASALSSALNVMRAAIQGEERLKSMPNNTVIMISFAACVALNLSTPASRGNLNLAPSVRNLIEETAAVLERIGNTPSHRNGASVLYGKYLREIVRQAPALPEHFEQIPGRRVGQLPLAPDSVFIPTANSLQSLSQAPPNLWVQPLQFSTMSDNEIIETVLHADQGFDSTLSDLPIEENSEFMWLDWMNPPEFGFQSTRKGEKQRS